MGEPDFGKIAGEIVGEIEKGIIDTESRLFGKSGGYVFLGV